ncbi:hypothetical protein MRX96_012161 [Rhipicephalus microplus]
MEDLGVAAASVQPELVVFVVVGVVVGQSGTPQLPSAPLSYFLCRLPLWRHRSPGRAARPSILAPSTRLRATSGPRVYVGRAEGSAG